MREPSALEPVTGAAQPNRKCEKFWTLPLKVPKLRAQTFETAIIERYRRRESSVEEALIEMYLAGVSVRRVEDIMEALWGTTETAPRDRVLTADEIRTVWEALPRTDMWEGSRRILRL